MFYYSWIYTESVTAPDGAATPDTWQFRFPNTKGFQLRYAYITEPLFTTANNSGAAKALATISLNGTLAPIVANPVITGGPTVGTLSNSGLTLNFDHSKALEVDVLIPPQYSIDVSVWVVGLTPAVLCQFTTTIILGFDDKVSGKSVIEGIPPADVHEQILFPGKNPTRVVNPREYER